MLYDEHLQISECPNKIYIEKIKQLEYNVCSLKRDIVNLENENKYFMSLLNDNSIYYSLCNNSVGESQCHSVQSSAISDNSCPTIIGSANDSAICSANDSAICSANDSANGGGCNNLVAPFKEDNHVNYDKHEGGKKVRDRCEQQGKEQKCNDDNNSLNKKDRRNYMRLYQRMYRKKQKEKRIELEKHIFQK